MSFVDPDIFIGIWTEGIRRLGTTIQNYRTLYKLSWVEPGREGKHLLFLLLPGYELYCTLCTILYLCTVKPVKQTRVLKLHPAGPGTQEHI
jgi:hypothetical protein